MGMRRTLVALAALAPLIAMADVTYYAGLGAAGVHLQESINASVVVHDQAVGNVDVEYAFPCSAGPTQCTTPDGPFDFEGTDLGVRIFGGVRFLTYFGIEAGYVDLGEPNDYLDYHVPPGPIGCNPAILFSCVRPEVDSSVKMTDAITGWELYALGGYPLTENLEVFGKVGVFSWDSTFETTDQSAGMFPPNNPIIPEVTVTPSGKVKTDGTDPAWGIGVNYRISDRMILRGEGTWYAIQDIDQLWTIGFNVIVTL